MGSLDSAPINKGSILCFINKMVKADIPEHSRDSSPDKLSLVSSQGMPSRTNSSASSITVDTTRESSPDYRLEISIQDAPHQSLFSNNKEKKRNTSDKTPIPADSPLFTQGLTVQWRGCARQN